MSTLFTNRYQLVRVSRNIKTGPIPISYQSIDTCPTSCKLHPDNGGGCYAAAGFHTWLNWKRLSSGERGGSFAEFLKLVSTLPMRQLWRYAVAGDLCGAGDHIDGSMLRRLVRANKGKHGFTYTHKPLNAHNVIQITLANKAGFVINISADSPSDADRIAETGIKAPLVCLLPVTDSEAEKGYTTPNGRQIVTCPAVIHEHKNCANCGICAIADRSYIVGFPAHGVQKARVKLIASTGDNL